MDDYCNSFNENAPIFCKMNEWNKSGCTTRLPTNLKNKPLCDIRTIADKLSKSKKQVDWNKCFGTNKNRGYGSKVNYVENENCPNLNKDANIITCKECNTKGKRNEGMWLYKDNTRSLLQNCQCRTAYVATNKEPKSKENYDICGNDIEKQNNEKTKLSDCDIIDAWNNENINFYHNGTNIIDGVENDKTIFFSNKDDNTIGKITKCNHTCKGNKVNICNNTRVKSCKNNKDQCKKDSSHKITVDTDAVDVSSKCFYSIPVINGYGNDYTYYVKDKQQTYSGVNCNDPTLYNNTVLDASLFISKDVGEWTGINQDIIYFFVKDNCYKFSRVADTYTLFKSYPIAIEKEFPGIKAPIDTCYFNYNVKKCYFFTHDKYFIYDLLSKKITGLGVISQEFTGVPATIDSALQIGGVNYFFKDNQVYTYLEPRILYEPKQITLTNLYICDYQTGKVLAINTKVKNWMITKPNTLTLENYNGGASQKWVYDPITQNIINPTTGFCIDYVKNKIVLSERLFTETQRWIYSSKEGFKCNIDTPDVYIGISKGLIVNSTSPYTKWSVPFGFNKTDWKQTLIVNNGKALKINDVQPISYSGNNGTVTCDTYCTNKSKTWAPTSNSKCYSGTLNGKTDPKFCSQLLEKNVTCNCLYSNSNNSFHEATQWKENQCGYNNEKQYWSFSGNPDSSSTYTNDDDCKQICIKDKMCEGYMINPESKTCNIYSAKNITNPKVWCESNGGPHHGYYGNIKVPDPAYVAQQNCEKLYPDYIVNALKAPCKAGVCGKAGKGALDLCKSGSNDWMCCATSRPQIKTGMTIQLKSSWGKNGFLTTCGDSHYGCKENFVIPNTTIETDYIAKLESKWTIMVGNDTNEATGSFPKNLPVMVGDTIWLQNQFGDGKDGGGGFLYTCSSGGTNCQYAALDVNTARGGPAVDAGFGAGAVPTAGWEGSPGRVGGWIVGCDGKKSGDHLLFGDKITLTSAYYPNRGLGHYILVTCKDISGKQNTCKSPDIYTSITTCMTPNLAKYVKNDSGSDKWTIMSEKDVNDELNKQDNYKCEGDYGSNVACCGQSQHQDSVKPELRCPASSPKCVGYVYGVNMGHCTTSTANKWIWKPPDDNCKKNKNWDNKTYWSHDGATWMPPLLSPAECISKCASNDKCDGYFINPLDGKCRLYSDMKAPKSYCSSSDPPHTVYGEIKGIPNIKNNWINTPGNGNIIQSDPSENLANQWWIYDSITMNIINPSSGFCLEVSSIGSNISLNTRIRTLNNVNQQFIYKNGKIVSKMNPNLGFNLNTNDTKTLKAGIFILDKIANISTNFSIPYEHDSESGYISCYSNLNTNVSKPHNYFILDPIKDMEKNNTYFKNFTSASKFAQAMGGRILTTDELILNANIFEGSGTSIPGWCSATTNILKEGRVIDSTDISSKLKYGGVWCFSKNYTMQYLGTSTCSEIPINSKDFTVKLNSNIQNFNKTCIESDGCLIGNKCYKINRKQYKAKQNEIKSIFPVIPNYMSTILVMDDNLYVFKIDKMYTISLTDNNHINKTFQANTDDNPDVSINITNDIFNGLPDFKDILQTSNDELRDEEGKHNDYFLSILKKFIIEENIVNSGKQNIGISKLLINEYKEETAKMNKDLNSSNNVIMSKGRQTNISINRSDIYTFYNKYLKHLLTFILIEIALILILRRYNKNFKVPVITLMILFGVYTMVLFYASSLRSNQRWSLLDWNYNSLSWLKKINLSSFIKKINLFH